MMTDNYLAQDVSEREMRRSCRSRIISASVGVGDCCNSTLVNAVGTVRLCLMFDLDGSVIVKTPAFKRHSEARVRAYNARDSILATK